MAKQKTEEDNNLYLVKQENKIGGLGADELTGAEKRRVNSLLLAIQGYRELIIREADYLREVRSLGVSDPAFKLRPATIDAMIETALKFDAFIANDASFLGQYAKNILGEAEDQSSLCESEQKPETEAEKA